MDFPITNPDRIIFPGIGLTKGEMVGYYERIGEVMLPHMRGRPLTLHRFPEGIGEPGFYMKEAPSYFPDWIERVMIPVEERGGELQPQIVVDDVQGLRYLANQGTVTPHVWLSRTPNLEQPDKIILDLDPGELGFEAVRQAAEHLRPLLIEFGLVPFLMTTGSKGIHVVAPIVPGPSFDDTRAFVRDLSAVLVERYPDLYTLELSIKQRGGRLFLDYLRNSFAQNSVTPYALRARPGAPIATPLHWSDLARRDLDSQRYTIRNIFRRLAQTDDPMARVFDHAHLLPQL
jgi:bifunctional non-homologous end joining protein LigD